MASTMDAACPRCVAADWLRVIASCVWKVRVVLEGWVWGLWVGDWGKVIKPAGNRGECFGGGLGVGGWSLGCGVQGLVPRDSIGTVLNSRTTTSQQCAAVPRRARFEGSWTLVSLNSRLASSKEKEEDRIWWSGCCSLEIDLIRLFVFEFGKCEFRG